MLAVAFFQWWYGEGWLECFKRLMRQARQILMAFSLPILVKTLFAPWKQTVDVLGKNANLQQRLQAWIGNQISRVVGFLVRSFTLIAALLAAGLMAVAAVALTIVWPLLPLSVVWLFAKGAGLL